jgi:hypothetical protein
MSLVDVRRGAARTVKFAYQVEEFSFSPNSQFLLLTTEHGTVEVAPAHDGHASVGSLGLGSAGGGGDASSSSGSSSSGSGSSSSASSAVPPAKVVRSVQAHTGNCYCLALDPRGAHDWLTKSCSQ